MPTKAQTKTVIDAAMATIKADIDNILPSGVNIKDGSIAFGPTRYSLILDAGGSSATALAWLTSIQTALTAAGRNHMVERGDRRKEEVESKSITIIDATMIVRILNL